jgi:hypothetical protein
VGGRSTQRGGIEDTRYGGIGIFVVLFDWLGPIEVLASVRSKQKHSAESVGGTDIKSSIVLSKADELYAVDDARSLHKEIIWEGTAVGHEQAIFLPRFWGTLFWNGGE